MKKLFICIAWLGLLATILPSFLVFAGIMEPGIHKTVMGIGMILWFVTAPFVMKRKRAQ